MAKTGHPNFTLQYRCAWRGINKNWAFTSNYSGATLPNNQVLGFLQAVDNVVKSFMSAGATNVFLDRYAHYDGQNSAPTMEADYDTQAASQAAGWATTSVYGGAYTAGITGVQAPEACVVLLAPVGQSKTNKPVFLRHWVHCVPPGGSPEADTPPYAEDAPTLAASLGDGSLPQSRVLISASGKQGTWAPDTYFGAHKMSRKWKTKTSSSILGLASDLNQIKKLVEEGLIPAE